MGSGLGWCEWHSHRLITYLAIHSPSTTYRFLLYANFYIQSNKILIFYHYTIIICHVISIQFIIVVAAIKYKRNNDEYFDLYKFPQFKKGAKSNFKSVQVPLTDDNKTRR